MPRLVVDTNVLVSAVFWPGPPRRVLDCIRRGLASAVVSVETLSEVFEVIARPKFSARISATGARPEVVEAEFTALLEPVAVTRPPSRPCTDPNDDKFLALAEAADADFLITGDAALLEMESIGRTRIVTVAQFLDAV